MKDVIRIAGYTYEISLVIVITKEVVDRLMYLSDHQVSASVDQLDTVVKICEVEQNFCPTQSLGLHKAFTELFHICVGEHSRVVSWSAHAERKGVVLLNRTGPVAKPT